MRISDWSSDVCSSDLHAEQTRGIVLAHGQHEEGGLFRAAHAMEVFAYSHKRVSVLDVCVKPAADDADGLFRVLLDDLGDLLHRGGAHAALHLVEVDHLVDLGGHVLAGADVIADARSEEHTSELQSLMRISYAVFCLKTKKKDKTSH